MTVLMTWATCGPPKALITADLSRPYSTACRTSSFFIAPFEFGLWRLKMMYGSVLDHGEILKLAGLLLSRPGIDGGFSGVSLVRSWVPACMSASWVAADVTP